MPPRWVIAAYAALGVACWQVPLANVLHVESSAIVAAVGFFLAGMESTTRFDAQSGPARLWTASQRHLVALAVPLILLGISTLWTPNCDLLRGAGFFLLFAPPSVLLGVAVAFLATARPMRMSWAPGAIVGAVGVAVAGLGPLYDLGLHPQFFTYNHVFGGVMGPIYDAQVAVRGGLFWFRGLTGLWIAFLVLVGLRMRGWGRGWTRIAPFALALMIGGAYAFSTTLGFNVTESSLKRDLPGLKRTPHFEIRYDSIAHTPDEVEAWAHDHEFAYRYLSDKLDEDPASDQRILTFVYPSPDVKARLTGARTTSVAPVWLQRPQQHLLVSRLESSLVHELAHVFSRSFGLPGLNASWSVGLVEGLAVALEPPGRGPSPHDLVQGARGRAGIGEDLVAAVSARLSPAGFWTDRGAVSYTTMGSFVTYLIDAYGASRMKAVYARTNFREVYGKTVQELAAEWSDFLESRPAVHADAGATARRTFSRPSLFETSCPHFVPPYRRLLQQAERDLADEDTLRALEHLRDAVHRQPNAVSAHQRLARLRLQSARSDTGARQAARGVLAQIDRLNRDYWSPSIHWIRGDALGLIGEPENAVASYDLARALVSGPYLEARAVLLLRRATARHPDILRVLTRGGEPVDQARRLQAWLNGVRRIPSPRSSTAQERAVVLAHWTAIRWQAAHRPREAMEAWLQESALANASWRATWPRSWRTAWKEQRLEWLTRAEIASGRTAEAHQRALARSRHHRTTGGPTELWMHLAERARTSFATKENVARR